MHRSERATLCQVLGGARMPGAILAQATARQGEVLDLLGGDDLLPHLAAAGGFALVFLVHAAAPQHSDLGDRRLQRQDGPRV